MPAEDAGTSLPLFAPDDLSAREPTLEPASAAAAEAARAALGDGWSIAPERIDRIAGSGAVNENFLVARQDGDLVLKRRLPGYPVPLAEEVALEARARTHGVPVADLIQTKTGEPVLARDDGEWGLHAHVRGSHPQDDPTALADAARVFLALVFDPAGAGAGNFGPAALEELVARARERDGAVGDVCRAERAVIEAGLAAVGAARQRLEGIVATVHTDYHPLNLLVSEGAVVCVLDFEDVKPYPVLPAFGFAAYKLIRAVVTAGQVAPAAAGELLEPWLRRWRERFPGAEIGADGVALGATYRVLDLIELILRSSVLERDDRFAYDLEKQARSLHEIRILFGSDPPR